MNTSSSTCGVALRSLLSDINAQCRRPLTATSPCRGQDNGETGQQIGYTYPILSSHKPAHLGIAQSLSTLVPHPSFCHSYAILIVMDSNSINSTCNLPSVTVSGMDSTLGLSLMDTLGDDAILSLCSSSTLDLGHLWSLTALLAPGTEFDFQSYTSNAFKHEIPSTLNSLCAQVQPHSSLLVPSPATSAETLSPFNPAHVLDNTTPSVSPVGYAGLAFLSPATMGQDTALPFLVGSPSPADVIAHAVQSTTAQALPGISAPCSVAASFVCQHTVSSAKASPVQAPSTAAQGGPMRLESLFKPASTSAGQPKVSYAPSRS